MTTSIHGLETGILDLLNELMEGEPGMRSQYAEHISKHFDKK